MLFRSGLLLDQEDAVDIERARQAKFAGDRVNIAVVLLPRMSNFTDFNPLTAETDVVVRYAEGGADLDGADVVVLPGSKNTIDDFGHLRSSGMAEAICRYAAQGKEVVGICGGFQMLGRTISDPDGVEAGGKVEGLGLLNVDTELAGTKIVQSIEAESLEIEPARHLPVRGYFIHMGRTTGQEVRRCFRLYPRKSEMERSVGEETGNTDGAVSDTGMIWGTYLHGVFDRSEFRRAWINRIRVRKGLASLPDSVSQCTTQSLHGQLDRWADHLQANLKTTSLL